MLQKNLLKIKSNISNNCFSEEDIDKMINNLGVSLDENMNKIDFLNFYLYFGKDIEHYKIYSKIKNDNISWKTFKNSVLPSITFRDLER